MWGAIIGDIIGSTFEIENHRSKYFEFFRPGVKFTDDTITTIATMSILMKSDNLELVEKDKQRLLNELGPDFSYDEKDFPIISPEYASMELKAFCYTLYQRGFGGLFNQWLESGGLKPYESYGNGGLMRLSPVAYWGFYKGFGKQKTINTALAINNITHNHIEAQKVAIAYTEIIYDLLENKQKSLREKREIILKNWEKHQLDKTNTVQYYLMNNGYNMHAKHSLEIALTCIREASDYKTLIQNIVCCGGDTDTYATIAGGIAEAIWDIPDEFKESARKRFNRYEATLLKYLDEFYKELEESK